MFLYLLTVFDYLFVCSSSLTHSLTHSINHSLTYSLNQSLNHSLTKSFSHSLTHSITYLLTHSLFFILLHSSGSDTASEDFDTSTQSRTMDLDSERSNVVPITTMCGSIHALYSIPVYRNLLAGTFIFLDLTVFGSLAEFIICCSCTYIVWTDRTCIGVFLQVDVKTILYIHSMTKPWQHDSL